MKIKKIKTSSHALDLIALYMRKIEPRSDSRYDPWNTLNIDDEIILFDSEIYIIVKIINIFSTDNMLSLYTMHYKDINPYCNVYSDFLNYIENYTKTSSYKIKCFEIKVLDFTII